MTADSERVRRSRGHRSLARRVPVARLRVAHGRDLLTALVLLAPAVLLLVPLKWVPLAKGFALSFAETAGSASSFVGWANYERMLRDPASAVALGNGLKAILLLPVFVFLPLVVAFALFRGARGWRALRLVYFLPTVMPAVMLGLMFSMLLGPSGPLVAGFRAIGLDQLAVPVLGRTATAFPTMMVIVAWAWMGTGVIIYLASMATASRDTFDVATIDGAGYWTTLRHVVIPTFTPTIAYFAVTTGAGLLLWMYPLIFSLTGGGPGYATYMPEWHIYQAFTMNQNKGYASALGMTLFAFLAVFMIIQLRVLWSRSMGDER